MSWPVAGTLMIESTERETKAELDRFCDAMLAIRAEIKAVEDGEIGRENNPLKRALHTADDLVGEWDRPCLREQGCFPPDSFRVDKYWPPVNRVDSAAGAGARSAHAPSWRNTPRRPNRGPSAIW